MIRLKAVFYELIWSILKPIPFFFIFKGFSSDNSIVSSRDVLDVQGLRRHFAQNQQSDHTICELLKGIAFNKFVEDLYEYFLEQIFQKEEKKEDDLEEADEIPQEASVDGKLNHEGLELEDPDERQKEGQRMIGVYEEEGDLLKKNSQKLEMGGSGEKSILKETLLLGTSSQKSVGEDSNEREKLKMEVIGSGEKLEMEENERRSASLSSSHLRLSKEKNERVTKSLKNSFRKSTESSKKKPKTQTDPSVVFYTLCFCKAHGFKRLMANDSLGFNKPLLRWGIKKDEPSNLHQSFLLSEKENYLKIYTQTNSVSLTRFLAMYICEKMAQENQELHLKKKGKFKHSKQRSFNEVAHVKTKKYFNEERLLDFNAEINSNSSKKIFHRNFVTEPSSPVNEAPKTKAFSFDDLVLTTLGSKINQERNRHGAKWIEYDFKAPHVSAFDPNGLQKANSESFSVVRDYDDIFMEVSTVKRPLKHLSKAISHSVRPGRLSDVPEEEKSSEEIRSTSHPHENNWSGDFGSSGSLGNKKPQRKPTPTVKAMEEELFFLSSIAEEMYESGNFD